MKKHRECCEKISVNRIIMSYNNYLASISAPKSNQAERQREEQMLKKIKNSLKKLNYTQFDESSFISRLLKLNIITNEEKNRLIKQVNWNIPAENLQRYVYSRRINKAQTLNNLNNIKKEISQNKFQSIRDNANIRLKYGRRKRNLNKKLNPSKK